MADQGPRSERPFVPEDLDKLQEAITIARQERERKEREFEHFIEAFREAPPAVPPVEETGRVPRALVESPPDADRPRSTRRRGILLVALSAAAVLAVAWAGWWPGGEVQAPGHEPVQERASVPPPTPPTTPPTVEPAAAPPVVVPPPPLSPLMVELTTERPVWMRITVDSARPSEREVPAGERIPLRADRRIIVRVGDAGGVRLTINGRDEGLLGGDGQVVSRTFTAPAQPVR